MQNKLLKNLLVARKQVKPNYKSIIKRNNNSSALTLEYLLKEKDRNAKPLNY